MALSRITLPVSYYGSPVAGKPVPFGKIYIGLPDLNPRIEANRLPLVIIQEDGVEVNIAPNEQPLETNAGGYISYQGSVVEVRVDGDYSMAVDDQNDMQQYYFPRIFDGVESQDEFYRAANFFDNDPSSASNAYVLISENSPRQTEYIDDQIIVFRPSDPNSGASTIEIVGDSGGLGAKDATLADGVTPIPSGFFDTSFDYYFRYDLSLDVIRYSEIKIQVDTAIPDESIEFDKLAASAQYDTGFLWGIKLEMGADADHDVVFNTGKCRDDEDTTAIFFNSQLTKQIDANWVEGDNAGGFPSSETLNPDDTIYCFVIAKDDGTTDAGFDKNLDASSLLADATGYTKYRRVGFDMVGAAANIVPNSWEGDRKTYQTPTTEFSANQGSAAVTRTLARAPSGIPFVIGITCSVTQSSASNDTIRISNPDDPDVATSAANSQVFSDSPAADSFRMGNVFEVVTNDSQQIRTRGSVGIAANTFNGSTLYVIDKRGKQ